MEKLSNIDSLLLNEDLLSKQSISTENFSVVNLLKIIDDRKLFNPDFFMYQFESALIAFYESIKNNIKFKLYEEKIKNHLEFQISEKTIEDIKKELIKILEQEFGSKDSQDFIIKKLI
jgi:hypothetical protein